MMTTAAGEGRVEEEEGPPQRHPRCLRSPGSSVQRASAQLFAALIVGVAVVTC